MQIRYSSNFLRKVGKLPEGEKRKLSERIGWFKTNPFDPRLRTQALTGKLKGYLAFSLSCTKRGTRLWVGKDAVLFIDVGSHNEVYR